MQGLFYAIQFLTVIPLGTKHADRRNLAAALVYFPIVGLFLGLLLAGCSNVLTSLDFSELASAAAIVILLIILTRGLHLDGLADTADGALSGKGREDVLRIMRDPHIGTMGVLALVSVILLKIMLLVSISLPLKGSSLVLMCVAGRWSLVFSIFVFPYARPEGKAVALATGINIKIFILATLTALALMIFLGGPMGAVILVIIAIAAYIIGMVIARKIGGMTGDTLGAVNEFTEIAVLLTVCLFERSNIWMP